MMITEEEVQSVIKQLNDELVIKIISEDTFPRLEFYSKVPKISNIEGDDDTVYSISLELINSPDENNNFIVMIRVGLLDTAGIIENTNDFYYPSIALIEADLKTCHLNTLYQLLVNSTREDIVELTKKLLEKIYIDHYKK